MLLLICLRSQLGGPWTSHFQPWEGSYGKPLLKNFAEKTARTCRAVSENWTWLKEEKIYLVWCWPLGGNMSHFNLLLSLFGYMVVYYSMYVFLYFIILTVNIFRKKPILIWLNWCTVFLKQCCLLEVWLFCNNACYPEWASSKIQTTRPCQYLEGPWRLFSHLFSSFPLSPLWIFHHLC